MEKNIKEYEENGFEGIDVNLETSLFEYGLIWKIQKDEDGNEDYHFIYGVSVDSFSNYNLFDWGNIAVNVNPLEEWDFVEWEKVAETSGMDKEEFLEMSLPMIVFDLIGYYGEENIFGSSYYPFKVLSYEEMEEMEEID